MIEIASHPQLGKSPAHRVTVTAAELVTPNVRRLTFEGETLAAMSAPLPAQWLRVVLPIPEEKARANRPYTIRRFYEGWSTLEVDFVLHGDAGPASAWARRAVIGDVVHLGNPRGGYRLDPAARWRLLAGDETALPAIASILEALPADGAPTWVVIETPSMDDVQPLRRRGPVEVHWLAREGQQSLPGWLLEDRIAGLSLPDEAGQVFVAGEGTAVRNIKQDLNRRFPKAVLEAKGYWLMGEADHRDRGGA